ncbi:MAG: hypothetical protein NVS3B21_29840 [Acidimicrobiales bacterium]
MADEAHKVQIRRVWDANYRCYGPRRVYKQLRREGCRIARCTVGGLMDDMGLRGVQRGKKRFTTAPDTTAPSPPDLVDRCFVAERPNELWLADITYASIWGLVVPKSFILDVFSRTIVGWQIAEHLRTDLVVEALEMAIWRRDLTRGPIPRISLLPAQPEDLGAAAGEGHEPHHSYEREEEPDLGDGPSVMRPPRLARSGKRVGCGDESEAEADCARNELKHWRRRAAAPPRWRTPICDVDHDGDPRNCECDARSWQQRSESVASHRGGLYLGSLEEWPCGLCHSVRG